MVNARAACLLAGLCVGLVLWADCAPAQERFLELRGRLVLPPAIAAERNPATITLFGATNPFAAQTQADHRGRFKFTKLLPGAYTVAVLLPRHGQTLRTVEVSRSAADTRGRVQLELRVEALAPQAAQARPQALVSIRQLSIPWNARSEYQRAWQRLGKRDVPGAVKHLEKAVARAPQFSEALNTLGTIAHQSGDYVRAEGYFRRALKYAPQSYEPLVNLGGTLLSQSRPIEALPFNQSAVKARPEDPLAQSQLGVNLFLLGQMEEALTYLKEAKKLDPAHFSHPQLVLAEIYLRRSDPAGAAAELEDFLHSHPDAAEAPKIRAEIARLRASAPAPPPNLDTPPERRRQ